MEAEYISRSEHAEFCKRVDAEDERQNKRLELLEENTKQINREAGTKHSADVQRAGAAGSAPGIT